MVQKPATDPTPEIGERLIRTVCSRLKENKRIRRTLPGRGRVHIDRQLPFLCLYRRPADREDPGTDRLVTSEASYVVASGHPDLLPGLQRLATGVIQALQACFGALLVVEVWSGPHTMETKPGSEPHEPPRFRLFAPTSAEITKTVDVLVAVLGRIPVHKRPLGVQVVRTDSVHPPGLPPLVSAAESRQMGVWLLGIEVPAVYRDGKTGCEFPSILRTLRRSFALALRRAFYQFSRTRTTHRPPHFHALGRNAVVRAVWQVDEQLAEVSNAFDYLLQLTPVNSRAAWHEFRSAGFQHAPEFHYRPLPFDAGLLKRQLFNIPLERIEDPALHLLFQEKQDELERKITMLADRDTPRFLPGSVQLFGGVDQELDDLADDLLRRLTSRRQSKQTGGRVSPERFAELARAEFDRYRRQYSEFKARAVVTSDVVGMLVSRGRLLISREMKIPASRVDAILAHEVGTHLVAYYNGRAQPFRQLYTGLAGYEELQEGVAVLSEYLMGGLEPARMRHLAARVVAARMLIAGAGFVEVFREMNTNYRFTQRSAYNIAARIFRGGGLTKDVVYLRGLRRILRYAQRGSDLEPLLVGKVAIEHLPIISELRFRNVLLPPPLRARYLEHERAAQRLRDLRGSNATVADLVSTGSE